ncbi:SdrD B-like domain-containing protein [Saccharothrix variisporea]|uniref:SdrD B-like protein n=1 Tax=Saccharothrix variisporea TaxID=543527 RepID=A0A495X5J0_9PSEU|nr:SdrD B-like domain-containing protein [Saccharothrix variisporea]RKT69232.1 SdrD B-like protein [Saccharothrix variisporea]
MSRLGASSRLAAAIALWVGVVATPAWAAGPPPAGETTTTATTPTATTDEPTTTATTTATAAPTTVTDEPTGTPAGEPTSTTVTGQPTAEEPTHPTGSGVPFDLRVTAAFERPAYRADEDITVRATVTNNGTGVAEGVQVSARGDFSSDYWPEFGYQGVRLDAGASASGTLVGRVTTVADSLSLVVSTRASGGEDANPADDAVTITVPITVVRGGMTGRVYRDTDLDGVSDPGEDASGVEVTAAGGSPFREYRTTTTSQGRFSFEDLPLGAYSVRTQPDDDWFYPYTQVDVGEAASPELVVRGIQWLERVVAASVSFDRQTYRPGETAVLTISLTNSGATRSGIAASWSTEGGTPHLDLGELRDWRPGATLPTGETRVFTVPVPIDGGMADTGYLRVHLTFSSPLLFSGSFSRSAVLRVPGARAPRVVGLLAKQRGAQGGPLIGDPVPNTVVYLRDQVGGAVLVRATTDAAGRFEFTDVPVGLHDFGVVGPWRLLTGREFAVRASDTPDLVRHVVLVAPGPDQPDPGQPGPVPPAPEPPATGPRPGEPDALAATGADVLWSLVAGLLTLAAGAGAVFAARRRLT